LKLAWHSRISEHAPLALVGRQAERGEPVDLCDGGWTRPPQSDLVATYCRPPEHSGSIVAVVTAVNSGDCVINLLTTKLADATVGIGSSSGTPIVSFP
jgi:hypothetical protein